jgi:hypothetical protein
MRDYWDNAEILYQPYYAYEEVLAPFGDATGADYSSKSLLAAMENLAGQVTGNTRITMPEVSEIKRQEVLTHFTEVKQANLQGDDTQSKLDALAEERRERANRYLAKELDNPIERLSQLAISARQQFMTAESVVTLSGVLISSHWLIYHDSALISVLGVLIAIASSIELLLTRFRLKQDYGYANIVLTVLIFGSAVGVLGMGGYLYVVYEITTPWWAMLLAAIAIGGELFAGLGGFKERSRQLDKTMLEIQQQQRLHVNSLEPYTDLNNEISTWKSFEYRLEKILSGI